MGRVPSCRRLARKMAVALVLAAVGALGAPHLAPGASQASVAQAQVPPREAPQITALTQATTSSIAVNWLPADNTHTHWIYVVKADGTGGRFQLAVPDSPASETPHVTTVSGLDAETNFWFAVLGGRAPSESSPSTWFRWSNWTRAATLADPTDPTDPTVPTVSLGPDVAVVEGGTASLTVIAASAPQTPLTVNYAIGVDDDAATVDGDSSDYAGDATGSITIAAGTTNGSIGVAITDDSDIDDGARETLVVTISLPEGSGYQLGTKSSAMVTIHEGVCDRTADVRRVILNKLADISACAQVTDSDLSGLTDALDLSGESLTSLQARDFRGLSGLQRLLAGDNSLTALPGGVFDGLTSLQELFLYNNSLASLPTDVFDGLASLQLLSLENNSLASLPADVFDGLTSLQGLSLDNNSLSALPADVFDGLTSLRALYLQSNPGSPFTFTAALEQPTATQVTVTVAQAAPFDLTVSLSITGGTLATASVVIPAGSSASPAITVTPSGDAPVTVNVTTASFPASGSDVDGVTIEYSGIQTGVGAANQAPTANAGADQAVDIAATVTLDASGSSDPDTGDTLNYSWTQTAGATVTLSSATAASPTFTAPSSAATLTFQVTAMDGKGGSDRDSVDITVDANDPPTFTSGATFSLAENTTAVGTVIATDPDVADSVTGYSLSGTDAALFEITAAGVLSFTTAPDFEDPQGGTDDDSNSYTLTVTATGGADDRALTATQELTVTVTDANEAPAFTSSATFSLAENTTDVGTVVAADPDADDSITGYTLSGTDAALFAITTAGALTFKSAPDYEAPQGGPDDDSNSYTLTATATSGTGGRALTATQDLTVTVTDGNEPGAPTARRINSSFVFNWDAPSDTGDSPITGYYAEGHWVGEVNGSSQPIRAIRITINNPNTRSVSILLHGDDPPNNILVNGVRTSWTHVSMWVRAINAVGSGPNSSSVSRDR